MSSSIQAPGLRAAEGDQVVAADDKKYTTSDYIIPPKVPQISNQRVRGQAPPPSMC